MKNQERWQPNKYIYKRGKLVASGDRKEVAKTSRLVAGIVAEFYDRNLRQHAKGRLLDLGCGKVPLYQAYRDYVSENVCVDWGNTLHKNEFLDLEHDLTKPLPFDDGEFDTIILSDVLEHLPEPEKLFMEMSRVLARNGKIIMNVPFLYVLHESPHDYHRYTEFALRRFVELAGLELVQLESIGGAPEVLADILAKSAYRMPLFGQFLSYFSQSFTAFFIKTRIGKRASDATKNKFPLGYFMVAQKVA